MSNVEKITNEVYDRHMAAQMFTDWISKLTPQQREMAANLIDAAPDMYQALLRIYNDHGWTWVGKVLAKADGKRAHNAEAK